MRIHSVLLVTIAIVFAIALIVVIVAYQRKIFEFGLTKNAEANRIARNVRAQETLQTLAANPKLTVAEEPFPPVAGKKRNPIVLCVINRNILHWLDRPSGSSPSPPALLQRLDTVDVEPVSYTHNELPALIAEISSAKERSESSVETANFNELIQALQKVDDPTFQVTFY